MKNANVLRNFLLAITGTVLFLGSFASAQRFEGKGTVTLAPTSSGGTQNVKVTNTSADPVLMRNVDNPAKQPFRSFLDVHFTDDGTTTQANTANINVPAGKRLVIKYAAISANLPVGQSIQASLFLLDNVGNPASLYPFTFTKQGTFGGLDVFNTSQPMELYLDPGTSAFIQFLRSQPFEAGYAYVALSGYFVDVP